MSIRHETEVRSLKLALVFQRRVRGRLLSSLQPIIVSSKLDVTNLSAPQPCPLGGFLEAHSSNGAKKSHVSHVGTG